nr:putative serine/threonine-protein kinase [Ipomoea batatas]
MSCCFGGSSVRRRRSSNNCSHHEARDTGGFPVNPMRFKLTVFPVYPELVKGHSVGTTTNFSYTELREATNNFSQVNKIGRGGFGTVYKGTLRGLQVAVKALSAESRQGIREFLTEIETISNVKHPNLVELIGCCVHGDNRLLVYEYLENRSLDRALFGGQLTLKADVYSFGVLILEVISARSSSSINWGGQQKLLLERAWELYEGGNLLELVDSDLGQYPEKEVLKYMKVALFCTQANASRRPMMSQVIDMLSKDIRLNEKELTPPGFFQDSDRLGSPSKQNLSATSPQPEQRDEGSSDAGAAGVLESLAGGAAAAADGSASFASLTFFPSLASFVSFFPSLPSLGAGGGGSIAFLSHFIGRRKHRSIGAEYSVGVFAKVIGLSVSVGNRNGRGSKRSGLSLERIRAESVRIRAVDGFRCLFRRDFNVVLRQFRSRSALYVGIGQKEYRSKSMFHGTAEAFFEYLEEDDTRCTNRGYSGFNRLLENTCNDLAHLEEELGNLPPLTTSGFQQVYQMEQHHPFCGDKEDDEVGSNSDSGTSPSSLAGELWIESEDDSAGYWKAGDILGSKLGTVNGTVAEPDSAS